MDITDLIAGIDDELSRLREVRALLAGDGAGKRGPRRTATSSESGGNRPQKKRTLSAAARAKIGAAQKKRWAKQKATAANGK